MILRTKRYKAPAKRSSTEISPIQPAQLPRNKSSRLSGGATPSFSEASGVAEATMSAPLSEKAGSFSEGAVKRAMSPGNAKNRKTRAASAGFTTFFPIPPYSCFTITIAKKLPTAGIQSGTDTGRQKARSIPVTAAERSPISLLLFMIRR